MALSRIVDGCYSYAIKGSLSGLKQFLATEGLLRMTKNAFYFIIKALFILKVFKFLSRLFYQVEKTVLLDDKVNFIIYNITTWLPNICNTHIDQYPKK